MNDTPRVVMRIEVSPQAKAALEDYCTRGDKIQSRAVSRLLEWFAKQPDIIQAAIMNDFPEAILADVNKALLKHILNKQPKVTEDKR